jgi:uncharacterized protein (DUF885 family)
VTSLLPSPDLPRPDAGTNAGTLDTAFYDLVEARVRRVFADNPVLATYLGVHEFDDSLGDPGRDAVLAEIAADKAHLAAVEAIDPAQLSTDARFERDLEIHNLRLQLFASDEIRQWERRASAAGEIGDGVFALFARGAAPLAERLGHIAGRLEAAPAYLRAAHTRAVRPQVAPWQRIDQRYARDLPRLFAEVRVAADGVLAPAESARLDRAIEGANAALVDHEAWLEDTIAHGTDDWPLGGERYDELLRRRALDDLDADGILEIGWEQLRRNHEGRRAALRELDADADEASLIERLKSDHPATFDEALEGYRDAMRRARAYLLEHDLVTIPDDERIEVIATPDYLRSVMPFAAYFSPAKFDADRRGIYIVTPAVDDDPSAMREHYYASISNTSIHEAYPGHHLQFAVAEHHPSLTRLLTDAPEFVEGWGMYSEQMMREEGFDAGPAFRASMYTDAIWRSCRIILDIRMHRGELTTDEATDFLVEHTSFELPNARAEVRRYTYTPGYQLSYLLGKVLILGLREEEKRRLGERFSLKRFHDTLLRNGSIPVSFHRRVLRSGDGG